jgi:hypothetical protein
VGLTRSEAQNEVLRGLQRRVTAAESVEPLALDEPPSRTEFGMWVGLMDGLEEALCENERLRAELAAYFAPNGGADT